MRLSTGIYSQTNEKHIALARSLTADIMLSKNSSGLKLASWFPASRFCDSSATSIASAIFIVKLGQEVLILVFQFLVVELTAK